MDGTILIVEDNPDDETLIRRSLKKYNVKNRIDVAHDGAEALDYMFAAGDFKDRQGGNPAVVLLDIRLPKIDGLEVLKRVRADPRTKRTPVVMLTSSDEQEDKVRSYDLGCNSYVRKPVDFEKFFEAISNLGLYWILINEPPPQAG